MPAAFFSVKLGNLSCSPQCRAVDLDLERASRRLFGSRGAARTPKAHSLLHSLAWGAMAPKPQESPKWLQKTAERLDEYGDVFESHTAYPSGEPAAPDTGYAARMTKEAFTRQLQSVQEGGRTPLMEWPRKPSEEMQVLRFSYTRAATFSPSRHAMIVRGRPAVVQFVMYWGPGGACRNRNIFFVFSGSSAQV